MKMNSHVVSGTIGMKEKVYLSNPVFLTFKHTQVSKTQGWFCMHYLKGQYYQGPGREPNPALIIQD